MAEPIRVGLAGLGRSGWKIHAQTLGDMPQQYRVTAVCDPDADRRAEAERRFDCRSGTSFADLLDDDDIELVVVATPNRLHCEHAMEALQTGRHVVCEKPMAQSSDDADRMIECAEAAGRLLAPFQNRRYESHLQKVKQILDSGRLGRIIQIRMTWHSFGRRWDWQTLREFGGGALFNNGAHLIDQALYIFGEGEVRAFAYLQNALSSGDSEDHVKVVLQPADGGAPAIDIELTNASAYPHDRWHVMGTDGGLRGTTEQLEWKWVDWASMPPRPVSRDPAEGRKYNKEPLIWSVDRWQQPEDEPHPYAMFYGDLFDSIRAGKPLFITPQSVRRQIQVLEACRDASGAPLSPIAT